MFYILIIDVKSGYDASLLLCKILPLEENGYMGYLCTFLTTEYLSTITSK